MQRLSESRRKDAVPVTAIARHGPGERPLAPLLTAIEATSSTESAAALTDGNVATAWHEDRPGQGQGEFVVMQAPFDVPIARFAVTVAPTSPTQQGAAPETFYLATNTRTYEVTLPEDAWSHPGEAYDVLLPAPVQSSCYALVLGDAFTRGRAHPEVSVAELTGYSAFDRAAKGTEPAATLADVATALARPDSRGAAAALLERAGPAGIDAMQAAYPTLDAAGRALALNVAASAATCATSASLFIAALTDDDSVVRGKALARLEQPACGREALPALVQALAAPRSRRSAAPLVALLGRERALPSLVAELGEGTVLDRKAVRGAVALAAKSASADDLARYVREAGAKSPGAGVEMLRAFHDRLAEVPSSAGPLVSALLSSQQEIDARYYLVDAAATLAAAGDRDAASHLSDIILRDLSPEVRAHAAEFVASSRQPGSVAANALADRSPRVREAVLQAEKLAPDGSVAAYVIPLLSRDPWTFVRVAAARALGALPPSPASERALVSGLAQPAPRVRAESAVALGGFRRLEPASRRTLYGRLVDTKEEVEVRVAAARALAMACDTDALDELTRLAAAGASSPDRDAVALGLVATESLGAIHPKDIASRFGPLRAKGVRPDARAAAARAIEASPQCPLP
jgi:HEAT repeat protein